MFLLGIYVAALEKYQLHPIGMDSIMIFYNGMRPQQVQNLINKLGRKKWNVRICEKYPHGCGVLTYLARYLKGGPISKSRLSKLRIAM